MRTIESEADISAGLDALTAADPALAPVVALAGPVPLRRAPGGLAGLARIVTAQQLSKAAADTIWSRVERALDPFSPATVLAADEPVLRACGLSAGKARTFRAVAEALDDGRLDLAALAGRPAEEVSASLCAIRGIGPWTAEIYALFCLGHADIFPSGDLALRVAVADALGLAARPGPRETAEIAARWAPWRGVAARLFWAYYAARGRKGDTLPV